MKHRLLMSVAAAALIAGSGLVHAQTIGGNTTDGAASGPGAASTPHPVTGDAPIRGGFGAAPLNGSSGARAEEPGRGSDSGMRSSQSDQRPGERNQRAQDQSPGQKSNMRSDSRDNSKAGQDMKAEDRNNNMRDNNSRAEDRNNMRDNNRNATEQGRDRDSRSTTTTGQAGAGAKLSSDQRSKITTVIKQQRVEPASNINFSISVGTRVPREVRFHPLPAEIVTVYPDWRGYEFFLVRDEIVVVNPRTLEIVAVLDA
jgi:hypothetical protein